MNNPVEVLLKEHSVILSFINDQEARIKSEEDPEKKSKLVVGAVNFLRDYGDLFHHNKEEEILFKRLESHPEFHIPDMLDELEDHHERFREYASDILLFISESNITKAVEILEQYFEELSDHIAIENDELFILTESLLSQDELEKLYFLFVDSDMAMGIEKKLLLELPYCK